jgi:hypothetical protein
MRLPPEALLLAALVPLAACYEDDDHCHDCGPPVFLEIEPNDVPAQANSLGTLYPGDWLAIEGRLSEFGPDLLDGFTLRSGTAIQIQFALYEGASGADFDVCLYDPDTGQYVYCWETSAHPETGAFSILGPGKDVHLVLSPFLGDAPYRLELYVYDACCYDATQGITIEGDGERMPLRPFSSDRWARYAAASRAEEALARLLPGELIEIDPASGELTRTPLVLQPLLSR